MISQVSMVKTAITTVYTTPGIMFRGYRTVSFDGCKSIKVPDTAANRARLGKQNASNGEPGYPALSLMALAETGTRALLGRTAVTDAVQSVPGTDPDPDPDRASYQIAVETAQNLVITARNITGPGSDLAGEIGLAVLAHLHGPRRPRVCARKVKSSFGRR
jgi:hypothetical protein